MSVRDLLNSIPFVRIMDRRRNAETVASAIAEVAPPRVLLVGNPNVGKSVVFGRLTGAYATVSNYPGTTVEVSRGVATLADGRCELVDTPGMYSLMPISEEERVARSMVLWGAVDLVIHVADARTLDRMLPFTLQLIEAGLPVVLAINMMDEADRAGVKIDASALERRLTVPVVKMAAAAGRGVDDLRAVVNGIVFGILDAAAV